MLEEYLAAILTSFGSIGQLSRKTSIVCHTDPMQASSNRTRSQNMPRYGPMRAWYAGWIETTGDMRLRL
jgi:hypothetical protein